MKRSVRMDKIADINHGIENVASASFASIMSQYEYQDNQLKQLRLYREEYQERLNERMKNPINVTEIRDYQYFFATLDKAIEQQEQNVELIARQMESSKVNWLQKKQDTEKVSRVAEKFRLEETFAQMKTEQKESDELNLQRFFLKRNNQLPH